MCYKDEVQKRNEEALKRRFNEDNVPYFIQRYFVNLESMSGAINYWIAIKDLLIWLMNQKIIKKNTISSIDPVDFMGVESEDITRYLKDKEKYGEMSPTTLYTRKNIFSSFWGYLKRTERCPVQNNIITDVKYKGISANNNLIKKLPSDKQLDAMQEKIMRKKDSFIRDRNIIILRLLKGTGIREGELAGLDMEDLFLDAEMPYINVLGKGKYRKKYECRIVYLTGDATKALMEWLEKRSTFSNIIDVDAVFLNKNGKRMSEANIKNMFETYGDGISCHMIRHYYATLIARFGNLAFAQQQLGHKSANTTTNIYANGAYGMKDYLMKM